MYLLLLSALLGANRAEVPPDVWSCENQIEVWCTVDGCAAKAEDETTPFNIWARRDGAFSICAYSGCWDGETRVSDVYGRLVWAANDVAFQSANGGFTADVSLLIIERDGVGFVRVGGFASPVLCQRRAPGE